jgi:hypothetical protein
MYGALKQKLVNGGRAAHLAATTAVCSLALGGVFVLGSWSARANSAEGLTRSLGFEGVLTRNGTPLTGSQTITFRFKKASQEVCTVPNLNVDVATNGVFRTSVPLTACPESLFDGAEVRYEIVVNSETVVSDQPIYSVPYAKYAEQLGTAFCPVGYTRVATTPHGICRRGNDEVVRVGSGASAFWIDRFEASVWNQPDGAGTQYGAGLPYPSTFPVNGQAIRQNMLYAARQTATHRGGVARGRLADTGQREHAYRCLPRVGRPRQKKYRRRHALRQRMGRPGHDRERDRIYARVVRRRGRQPGHARRR